MVGWLEKIPVESVPMGRDGRKVVVRSELLTERREILPHPVQINAQPSCRVAVELRDLLHDGVEAVGRERGGVADVVSSSFFVFHVVGCQSPVGCPVRVLYVSRRFFVLL